MSKLDTLLECLPPSGYKNIFTVEINALTKQRDDLLAVLLDVFPYEKHQSLACDCPTCAAIASVKESK